MMISRIDPRSDPRWQAFLENHPHASIFHTSAWLEALRRTYGYETVVYASNVSGRGLVNGIPFCQIRSRLTGRRLVSLPFSDHCQPLVDNPEEVHELLAAVKDDARKNSCKYFEIRPLASYEPHVITAGELTKSHDAVIHRLDLRRNIHDIFRGFHKDCIQRKIARSEREEVRYEEGTSEDLLGKFYRLLLLTRRRHQLPPQPLLWFRNLIGCLGDSLKIRVASTKEGTPVASMITLSFKNVVTYKYGCSDPRFNALGGMVLLTWRTIQEARANGAVELDLGRSDHDTPGLITFKDHWGASRHGLTYYTYPARVTRLSTDGVFITAARRLVTAVPDSLFATLGGLLYRHVG